MKTSKLINLGQKSGCRDQYGRNQPVSITVLALFAIYYSLFALPAMADEYHYNNILVGDRAAGMGGAYTAISDDPSGLYYNPAGIVYAPGSNVSVSANAFHQSKVVYKNALGNGMDYKRYSYALLPNFFGIVQPMGKGKVGFSYAVPDSILEDQNQTFYAPNATTTRYAINFNKNDNTYNFGPSYAQELSQEFSVGLTLYAHYRKNQFISNQLINKTGGTYEWLNQFYNNTEWGIKPILGFMWSPTDKLSTGLSVSKVNVVSSEIVAQTICSGDAAGACLGVDTTYVLGAAPVRAKSLSENKRGYPLTTTIGVAYFPSKTLIVSGDFSYYSKVKDSTFGDKEAIWNAALGVEYYLSEKLALKGGLFTDKANTPKITSTSVNALDNVDLYGGSLSASYFTRQSSITIGSTYRLGSGKAQILGGSQIQDLKSSVWTSFLSASYFY